MKFGFEIRHEKVKKKSFNLLRVFFSKQKISTRGRGIMSTCLRKAYDKVFFAMGYSEKGLVKLFFGNFDDLARRLKKEHACDCHLSAKTLNLSLF